MIRFAARQFRTQASVAAMALVAAAVVALITGPSLVHLYDTTVANCTAGVNCDAARTNLLFHDRHLNMWAGIFVIAVPGLLGVFWGAPLVARELETGTFRLAWTQSVTRRSWLAVKVALGAVASMAAAGLFSLAVTWWAHPLDLAGMDRFADFDRRGIVPIGYAAFAFALGLTAGVLIRRTLPAMATTLAVFVAVRLAFVAALRPHLLAPAHLAQALDPNRTGIDKVFLSRPGLSGQGPQIHLRTSIEHLPNAWTLSTHIVDGSGHAVTSQAVNSTCPGLVQALMPPPGGLAQGGGTPPAGAMQAMQDCVAKVAQTYHVVVTYQPASRYWPLQWYETGIFVAAAVALVGLCFWLVRRRLN